MNSRRISLVVHNVRSAHNVGSILRTADGLGLETVYLTGYTPYPEAPDDRRMPHVRRKTANQISKTALGAETSVAWRQFDDLTAAIDELKLNGFIVTALEQPKNALALNKYKAPERIALLVGNEIHGLDKTALKLADTHVCIPMLGAKESFNVSIAAAMALYHLRYQA